MVEDLQNTPLMASVRFAKGLESGTKRRMLRLVRTRNVQPLNQT